MAAESPLRRYRKTEIRVVFLTIECDQLLLYHSTGTIFWVLNHLSAIHGPPDGTWDAEACTCICAVVILSYNSTKKLVRMKFKFNKPGFDYRNSREIRDNCDAKLVYFKLF